MGSVPLTHCMMRFLICELCLCCSSTWFMRFTKHLLHHRILAQVVHVLHQLAVLASVAATTSTITGSTASLSAVLL